jgi:outer membrane receptor protein involved in Fe transport
MHCIRRSPGKRRSGRAIVLFCLALLFQQGVFADQADPAVKTMPAPADPVPATQPPADKRPAEQAPAKPPAAKQSVETISVKGSQDSYDARRDDTATKIVVGEEEITKFGDTQLADVFKRLPGVTVTGSEIRMRGLGSGYTQILLNGERAPPGFAVDTLSPDLVERIEIIRAATAEFSTQSIAGTINIVLKKKVSVAQREVKAGLASGRGYRAPNANFNLSDRDGRFSYSANGYFYRSIVNSTGSSAEFGEDANAVQTLHREANSHFTGRFEGFGLSPRLNWTLADGDTLTAQSFVNINRARNSNERRYALRFGVPPAYDRSITNAHNDTDFLRSDLNWVHKLAEDAKLDLKLGVNASERNNRQLRLGYDPVDMALLDSDVAIRSTENGITSIGKFFTPYIDGHSLSTGWDGGLSNTKETRAQRDQALGGAPAFSSDEDFTARVRRLAAYAQDEWNVSKNWSLYLGLRWESITTRSEGNTFATVNHRASVLSPLAQTLYKLPDRKGEQLRLALTRTYKAPSGATLIPRRYLSLNNSPTEPDSQGNPDLRPELATGIDLAAEKFWDQGALMSLSGSVRRISDFNRNGLLLIAGRWVSLPINDGRATTKSLEYDAKFPLQTFITTAPPVDFRFNMGRNWSTVDAVPGPFNRLAQQTPFSATVGSDYRMKGGEWIAGGSYSFKSGGTVRTSVNQRSYLNARREMDFYGLWKFRPGFQARLSLSNILRQDSHSESSYFDANGLLRTTSTSPSSMNVRLNLEMKL